MRQINKLFGTPTSEYQSNMVDLYEIISTLKKLKASKLDRPIFDREKLGLPFIKQPIMVDSDKYPGAFNMFAIRIVPEWLVSYWPNMTLNQLAFSEYTYFVNWYAEKVPLPKNKDLLNDWFDKMKIALYEQDWNWVIISDYAIHNEYTTESEFILTNDFIENNSIDDIMREIENEFTRYLKKLTSKYASDAQEFIYQADKIYKVSITGTFTIAADSESDATEILKKELNNNTRITSKGSQINVISSDKLN